MFNNIRKLQIQKSIVVYAKSHDKNNIKNFIQRD